MKALFAGLALVASALCFAAPPASAHEALNLKNLGQKKVETLPPGELYWRIATFPSIAQAQSAAGPYGLAVQSRDGKAWLFTLGAKDAAGAGTRVSEVGPIAPFPAHDYLLRVNEATGEPGATTSVHSHPGSEAYFVLDGEQSVRGPNGVLKIHPGQSSTGNGAYVPMQVTSTGAAGLHALVMFVVDANRPFSSPAHMP
jgi:mannose-6-phosphate isomerase-like protein (cupin superfamily)